jgi:hypothetical protein
MDLFTSNRDDSSVSETAKAPDRTRSSRKLKRSKAKLATLGVAAAVAAGTFAAIEIGSANAAAVSRAATVTVRVQDPGPLCSEVDPAVTPSCFATEADREIERENGAKLEANVQGSPGVCGTPFGEPNPTRGDMSSATIDKFSAEQWRVTMTFHCTERDNPA